MEWEFGVVVGGGLVTQMCPTLATPWTVACQASLSLGFSRQEHWIWVSRCKPIIHRMDKPQVQLCSTRNSIQYSMINHNRKEYC